MARPTKYDARFHIPWVRSLARRGLTVKEIAQEMGIARSTLNRWAKEHEEFSDTLNKGRSEADALVEDSLFRRAVGSTTTETRKIMEFDKNGMPSPTRVETIERETPPDVAACIFWLKNRRPKDWRERPEMFDENDRPMINVTIPAQVITDGE